MAKYKWTGTTSTTSSFSEAYGTIKGDIENEEKRGKIFKCENCGKTSKLSAKDYKLMLKDSIESVGYAAGFCSPKCKIEYKYRSITLDETLFDEENEKDDEKIEFHNGVVEPPEFNIDEFHNIDVGMNLDDFFIINEE